MENNYKICIVGLGYVGLPLAHAFSKRHSVIGIDLNKDRVKELNNFIDNTNELSTKDLQDQIGEKFKIYSNISEAKDCSIFIVTVPTPVTKNKTPDLFPLKEATKSIASLLKKNDIVVYESTVYPGATEEVCVPLLENISGLNFNKDFFVGYSPERINPGDKKHNISNIVKVVSGSNINTLKILSGLYKSIVNAEVYEAPTIKIAEAAKVIENAQRDINIAFINELSIIFSKMGISTNEVLKAANTKWNFLNFRPGLVGGHCIGVDPYYLAYKSAELGYIPDIILAGRRLNDSMPAFISNQILKQFLKNNNSTKESDVLILGATFKENCPDIRNSKVVDLSKELQDFGFKINIYDPHVDPEAFFKEFGFRKLEEIKNNYSVIILAVSHNIFKNINPEDLIIENGVVFDVKGFYSNEDFLYL